MNSMELVRFPTRGVRPPQGPTKKSPPPYCSELVGPVRNAIVRARHLLVTQQRSDGSWLGRQTGDVSLASQLLFLLTFLERDDCELATQCAVTILNEQRPDGGWSVVPGGAADVSASVKAYFALKLTGHDPTDDRLVHARERIRMLGGADAADSYTRFFLALLGQLNYDFCGPIPEEGISFGGRESLLRAPMSIVWSRRPVRNVAMERGVRELFINKPSDWSAISPGNDEVNPSEAQLLESIEPSRVFDLSFPDLVWHIIALRAIEHQSDSREVRLCEEALHHLVDVDEETQVACVRFRNDAVSDSAFAIRPLIESGMSPNHPAIVEGMDFACPSSTTTDSLTISEISNLAESLRRYAAAESGNTSALPPDIDIRWDWQYANNSAEQIPDGRGEVIDSAIASCLERLRSDQQPDGGWSSLKGSHQSLQSSEPDVAGAVLEALAECADELGQAALDRGGNFLRLRQCGDGHWAKSDGTQQIQCTSSAIRGLIAAGAAIDEDCIAAAVNWLVIQQQSTGGWKRSSVQTAWAILGLVAAGRTDHPAVRRGIQFLLDSQDDEGGWGEHQTVLQNSESSHRFRNDLHSVCWPLLALSRFAVAASSSQPAAADRAPLRLVAATAEI
jgi:squalene-hopene/tetraprenyl-beta-curcumene cyclase